jgi:nitroreductase
MTTQPTANGPSASERTPDHPIDGLFHGRWSPRAFDGGEIPLDRLLGLFEAARFAPSGLNAQPWRFVYARRGTPEFERFLSLLSANNQVWSGRASALVALVSHKLVTYPGKPEPVVSSSHSFDSGAAWAQLALQAHLWGYATHAIGGFDRARAKEVLGLPESFQTEIFIAIGRKGDPSTLPEWAVAREKPSDRKPITELVREGRFTF